jgi:hypothetical protein
MQTCRHLRPGCHATGSASPKGFARICDNLARFTRSGRIGVQQFRIVKLLAAAMRSKLIVARASVLPLALVIALAVITLTACSAINRQPVPEGAELNEVMAAPGPIRIWGDVPPRNVAAIRRQVDAQRQVGNLNPLDTRNYLAVSGGGSDGAFGAGLLVGWSETRSRPRFDVVTGVSTGALIAPFAFLGSSYDAELKEIYTTYGQKDLAWRRPLLLVGAEASIASDAPMVALVERYVSFDFLADDGVALRGGVCVSGLRAAGHRQSGGRSQRGGYSQRRAPGAQGISPPSWHRLL